MKNIIVALALPLALAVSAQARTQKIQARYQGVSFTALTGDQDNTLTKNEKHALVEVRANDVCHFLFGEAIAISWEPLAPAKGDAILLNEDGEVIITSIAQTTPPGYLGSTITGGMDINPGLIFTEITCNN
jgi:hypothetical protein